MSKSRAKGTLAETAVVNYLNDEEFDVERRALAGAQDKGDIAGLPGVIEVKNEARFSLSEWLAEAELERQNAKAPWGVVWAKRRGKGAAADWYVIMSGATFVWFLKALYKAVRPMSTS